MFCCQTIHIGKKMNLFGPVTSRRYNIRVLCFLSLSTSSHWWMEGGAPRFIFLKSHFFSVNEINVPFQVDTLWSTLSISLNIFLVLKKIIKIQNDLDGCVIHIDRNGVAVYKSRHLLTFFFCVKCIGEYSGLACVR